MLHLLLTAIVLVLFAFIGVSLFLMFPVTGQDLAGAGVVFVVVTLGALLLNQRK